MAKRSVLARRKAVIYSVTALGAFFGVIANYASFGVDSTTQKIVSAISLVALPALFNRLSSTTLKVKDTKKIELAFRKLLKQRRNLERISYDYDLDFEAGTATRIRELLPAVDERALPQTGPDAA